MRSLVSRRRESDFLVVIQRRYHPNDVVRSFFFFFYCKNFVWIFKIDCVSKRHLKNFNYNGKSVTNSTIPLRKSHMIYQLRYTRKERNHFSKFSSSYVGKKESREHASTEMQQLIVSISLSLPFDHHRSCSTIWQHMQSFRALCLSSTTNHNIVSCPSSQCASSWPAAGCGTTQSQPEPSCPPVMGSMPGGSFCCCCCTWLAEPLRLTVVMAVLALRTLSSVVEGVRSTAELVTAATPPPPGNCSFAHWVTRSLFWMYFSLIMVFFFALFLIHWFISLSLDPLTVESR